MINQWLISTNDHYNDLPMVDIITNIRMINQLVDINQLFNRFIMKQSHQLKNSWIRTSDDHEHAWSE